MTDKQLKFPALSATQKATLAAGAFLSLASASETEADIVYVDDRPVEASLFSGGDTFNWDVDGDGSAEFQLRNRTSSFLFSNYNSSQSFSFSGNFYAILNLASTNYYGGALNGRGFVGNNDPAGAVGLASSVSVGPTLTGYQWGASNVGFRTLLRFDSSFFSSYNSATFGSTYQIGFRFEGFEYGSNLLGFRFEKDGELHYGWAEIELDLGQATISRWAYESDANTSIHVGSTVPEPGSLRCCHWAQLVCWLRVGERRNRQNSRQRVLF